jgi:hypothetical protein
MLYDSTAAIKLIHLLHVQSNDMYIRHDQS